MNERIVGRLMDEGVTIMDPSTTFVEKGVKVGRDTVLYPFTLLEGETEIGEDCVIGPMFALRMSPSAWVIHPVCLCS